MESPIVSPEVWYIYIRAIDDDGACDTGCDSPEPAGVPTAVTDDPALPGLPAMAWTGSAYGMAWRDVRDPAASIYFALADADGNKLGGDKFVSPAAAATTVLTRLPATSPAKVMTVAARTLGM